VTERETLTMTTAEQDSVTDLATALRRSPRIREEDVRQAADALLLEGGRPTVERVRSRLGRGSPNTIALFLDRWWAQLGARLRDLPGQELPSVPEPVSKALMGLWSEAIDQARALLKDSLAAQTVELETQRAALAVRTAELERALQEFARERAAMEQTVAMAQEQLGQAHTRHQADVSRITELQSETARLLEQRERLQREASGSAARLDAARIEHQEASRVLQERTEATEKHWIKQVDEIRQALGGERKRTETLDRQRVAEIARLSGELQAAIEERAQLRAEAGEALASARADISRLTETARLQQARADEAERRLGEQAANALTREQFEHRLREVLAKTLLTVAPAGGPRRRFMPNPGEKPRR
jgi:hypothetical protein